MRMQLAGWCVLVAVTSGFAADKPQQKTLPQTSTLEMYKAEGRAEAQADSPNGFTITKPVGTWARDLNIGEANCRFTLEITDNRLTLKIDAVSGGDHVNGRVDVDYSINKESVLFGVIDSCDVKSTAKLNAEQLGQFAKFSGQPFAVRFRVEEDALTFKDFKGLGVGLGEKEPELITGVLALLNGRYTKVDPKKPLPPRKAAKKPAYNSDPLLRQDQLLKQSESHGLPGPLHIPPRPADPPSHLTPDRIHGGILKADPPKEDDGVRLGGVPYPTPHYLKHYPTYVAPDPAFPLQRERDVLLDPTGEFGRRVVTSAYVGPITGSLFACRPPAELVAGRSERR